jgi:hypothetical protein
VTVVSGQVKRQWWDISQETIATLTRRTLKKRVQVDLLAVGGMPEIEVVKALKLKREQPGIKRRPQLIQQ